MNKLTISQAMLKIAELERLYKQKLRDIRDSSCTTVSYILELDGKRYDCNESFDFKNEFDNIIILSKKIESLRNAISKANNTALVVVDDESFTIQDALNKLKIYREQVSIFDQVISFNKPSKTRKVDAAGTQPYYKVIELTFNANELLSFIENLNQTILKIELAINEANNKTVITLTDF